MPPCVITSKDKLEFVGGVLHLNGKPHPSLNNCKFVGDVHFSIPIVDVPPAAQVAAPQPVDAAVPTQVIEQPAAGLHSRPQPVESVNQELGDLKEMLDVAKEVMDLPPWMAALMIGAVLFMKWNKQQKQNSSRNCAGHAALVDRVDDLEAVNAHKRLRKLENKIVQTLADELEDDKPKQDDKQKQDADK